MGDRQVSPYGLEPISGQTTGTADGSVVTLPSIVGERIVLRPLASNTGVVAIGRTTGTFNVNSGLELEAADPPFVLEGLRDLSRLQLYTPGGGDGIGFLVMFDPVSYPLG